MDIEFHYWLTGFIAHEAGFSHRDAGIIAYSSQYVDDNDVTFEVESSGGSIYRNFISQTMNILKPKDELRRIYPIFHFIPGEPDAVSARRRDGKMHLLNTTPNSENANLLLDAAFNSSEWQRPYRIGIATHSFVDTFAHQNFVGWFDNFNAPGLNMTPDIGHADFGYSPDMVSHLWTDPRLVDGEVSNKGRFLSAAKVIFDKYCAHLITQGRIEHSEDWPAIEGKLIAMQGKTYTGSDSCYEENRMVRYKGAMPWLYDFSDKAWFDQAIKTEVRGMKDSSDGIASAFTIFKDKYTWREDVQKEETDWYKFQESVKSHERLGIRLLKSTFAKMGVDIGEA